MLNTKGLNKGNPGNKGGWRPKEWLVQKCQKLIDKNKLIEFLSDVAKGKDVEQVINENGEILKVPAHVKDRLKACEILLARGYGMPSQEIELGDSARMLLIRSVAAPIASPVISNGNGSNGHS